MKLTQLVAWCLGGHQIARQSDSFLVKNGFVRRIFSNIFQKSMFILLRAARFFLFLSLAMKPHAVVADANRRNLEIQQCTESDLVTWNDGRDQPTRAKSFSFSYIHKGSPSWFNEQQVKERIRRATQEWSKCGIRSEVSASTTSSSFADATVIVYWDDKAEVGFGLADLTNQRLVLGIQAFNLLARKNPTHDPYDTLQMVLSHEIGHFYGLIAHSRRCIDTLSYYHDGKGNQCFTRNPGLIAAFPEYRSSLPTACDILRCKKLNWVR